MGEKKAHEKAGSLAASSVSSMAFESVGQMGVQKAA